MLCFFIFFVYICIDFKKSKKMIYILLGYLAFSVILFIVEVKNAPIIDDSEPFLHDDYDPAKDPTLIS